MDPTFPLFPFFSAIGFLLSLVPLYWQIEAWNVGAVWYIFWTALSCLNQYFNSLIWAGNTVNSAPAWCEISIRIMMGASVGLPAASMCINRRLYYVASVPPTAVVSKADKRRAIIIDSCICGLFPVLYTALQVVVQRHRFDILEDIGCAPALYNSIATSFISFTWPLLLSFGSAVYCTLSLHAFAAARVTLAAGLSGHRSLTPTRFLRLNALALATLLLTVPLALLTIATNATVAFLSTEASGDVAPFHFALVAQIPRRLWSADASTRAAVELARWVSPACAILFFAFFGLAQEARTNYKRAFIVVSIAFWNAAARLGFTRPLPPLPDAHVRIIPLGLTKSNISRPIRPVSGTGSFADFSSTPGSIHRNADEPRTTFAPPPNPYSPPSGRSFVAVTPSATGDSYVLPPYLGWHHISSPQSDGQVIEMAPLPPAALDTNASAAAPRGRKLV